ncbi:DUF2852 domain-containing protein [Loktanella agnita]|uniref:DUF2852 domain-containing protein n=1 Tax=Loktanella agnita TaxID=287097 RepID=UPI0039876C5A
MTNTDMGTQTPPRHKTEKPLPVSVQLLSTLLFGVFGILAIIFAFNASWIAGLIVALVLGWRGGFAPGQWHGGHTPSLATLAPRSPEAQARSSGNTSFDAYRSNTLQRLEQEQTKFESFLNRLRDAKDKGEFDKFMTDRMRTTREAKRQEQ